ncbi:hypothetical protein WUBG_02175 [Wuchereria bancrofti]|nr:hypothetical protein WUBG_02175 [Wuchereria bancrofti]
MSLLLIIILLINQGIPIVISQIDLGSFSLGQNKRGDLKFVFNQAANILGFGGDRGLDVTVGDGQFYIKARQGALLAGERVGADSGIGINEAEGVDLRNFLNFGSNSPNSFNNPAGQFLSFLEKIKEFFTTGRKPLNAIPFYPQNEKSNVKIGSVFHNFETPEQQRISGETLNYMRSGNDGYDDYYHNVEIEDESAIREFKAINDSSGHENLAILNRRIVETEFNATTI